MVLGLPRKHKGVFGRDRLVRIVADGAIATGAIGDGRMIPLAIFDARARPDLAELVRVHQHLDPGDADCQWGQIQNENDSVALMLTFKRPIELIAVLPFGLAKYDGFVDQIVHAKALYIQPGKEGDRLKYNINDPKIYIEVPNTGFELHWEKIFYRSAFRRMRADGLNRQRAKNAAKLYITEWRKMGRFRVGQPR